MKYKHQYLIKEVTAGETKEIYKTQSSRYGYNIPRKENTGNTPEAVQKNNQRLAEDTLRQLINENFKHGDLHTTLKFFPPQRPKDPKEAQKHVQKWIRRMQTRLKKLEIEFKYIYAVEIGKKGAVHIHVIMNYVDIRIVRELWTHGTIYFVPLYSEGQYRELANYIIKQTSEMYKQKGWTGRRYTPSKNLSKPKVEKRRVNAKTWREEPKPPKGYIFDSTFPLENGVCEVTGLTYQRYGLILIKPNHERYGERRRC
ncbi:hypothetical protein [Hydrogenoanaerobacterium sp.]|uniref:rolling circle replication-associated protein n=1 Tax=Hydrogenoanaerobacterium sp. TaxID=2953763 RepID=UPI00289B3F64|nr:hypothetical protein [Hydrogenoanaerobacterium sp.]